MRTPCRAVALGLTLLAACYDPSEQPDTDATAGATTEGVDDGADDGASTGTSPGMTSMLPGDDDATTGADPTATNATSTTDTPSDSSGDASSDDGSTTTDGGSSESGPEPGVCGDGSLNQGEECDDGNMMPGDFCTPECALEPRTFSFTGASQSFVVPDWASAIVVEAWGAQGGGAECCEGLTQDDGGRGGYATGILAVNPGAEVLVFVGGEGVTGGAGGWNGGGGGGQYGAGGGGASDVRVGGEMLDQRVIVAGGGGGGNCGCPDQGAGGPGGGLNGAMGISLEELAPGGGGTQLGGGTPGVEPSLPGTFGVGGSFSTDPYHVGGGGGGWYGGGSAYGAGGGGGSSYIAGAADASTQADQRTGDGEVIVTAIP